MKNTSNELLSKRSREISPFMVMEILERAQRLETMGEHVIHMEIGEPDFNTPNAVKEAAIEAVRSDLTKYTHSLGLAELRQTIAEEYCENYGVSIDAEQVIVTTGTSAGVLLTFAALIDPHDEIILTNPGYPCYQNFIRLVDGVPVFARLNEENGWQVEPEAISDKFGPKTKAVVINSPANPTGTILSRESMAGLANTIKPGQIIISDEIYHGMVYEGRAHSILEFTDRAIVINGFSKLYAMTGWRLGYLVVPAELVRPIQKLQQNLFISAPTVSQRAAVSALKKAGPDVRRMIAIYDERRRWLVPRLRELGFGIKVEPTGAFYVLAKADHLNKDSYALALEILEKTKVAITPGIDFGDAAEGYLRFSYATSLEEIQNGCGRLESWLASM